MTRPTTSLRERIRRRAAADGAGFFALRVGVLGAVGLGALRLLRRRLREGRERRHGLAPGAAFSLPAAAREVAAGAVPTGRRPAATPRGAGPEAAPRAEARWTERPRQEPDALALRWIGVVGAAVVATVGVGLAFVAWWALGAAAGLPRLVAAGERPERISGVLQTRIAPDDPRGRPPPAPPGRAPAAFEWVDRERGLVRIPIEEAMDLVAERRRAP